MKLYVQEGLGGPFGVHAALPAYREATPAEIKAVAWPHADLEAATRQWEAEFPCVCGPGYSERGLVAPNCEHHCAEDGSKAIVLAALGADDEEER